MFLNSYSVLCNDRNEESMRECIYFIWNHSSSLLGIIPTFEWAGISQEEVAKRKISSGIQNPTIMS